MVTSSPSSRPSTARPTPRPRATPSSAASRRGSTGPAGTPGPAPSPTSTTTTTSAMTSTASGSTRRWSTRARTTRTRTPPWKRRSEPRWTTCAGSSSSGRAAGGRGGLRLGLARDPHGARVRGARAGVQHLARADRLRARTGGRAGARGPSRVRGGRLPHRRGRVRRLRLGRHAGARRRRQLPHPRRGGGPFAQARRAGPHPLHRAQRPGAEQPLDRAAHLPRELPAEPRGDEHDLRAPGVLDPRCREPAPALRPYLPGVLDRFEAAVDRVEAMYDSDFARAWRLYLSGSVAAFTTGSLQLFQVVFARGTRTRCQ